MNENDLTPTDRLFVAIADGSLSGVEEACEAGAVVNAVNSKNETPLFIACREGFAHIVDYLLKQPGIDITKGGYCYSRQELLAFVPDEQNLKYLATPLCAAVESDNCRIVKMLLKHEEADKYLQPNEAWEKTIASAFGLLFISPTLEILIKVAMKSDRKFLQFTMQKVMDNGLNSVLRNDEKLALLLKQFPSEVRILAAGISAAMFVEIVKCSTQYPGVDSWLSLLLITSQEFCSVERLRPYLLSALHLARQLRARDCEYVLSKALNNE